MTSALADKLHDLLEASLPAWRVAGEVGRGEDGTVTVRTADRSIKIAAAPGGSPFRWMISMPERTRGAASMVGVLRAVRSAIDPQYTPVRLRIASATPAPQ